MIILNENESLKIRLKEAHETNQRDFSVAYGDSTGTTLNEGGNKGRFSNEDVVVCAAPQAGVKRIIKGFTISNNDTKKGKFFLYVYDGNNEFIVCQKPLNAGECYDSLASNNGGGGLEKSVYDPNLIEADVFNMDNMEQGHTKQYVAPSDVTNWNNKQDRLVSGMNIKSINGNSLVGSGDISLEDISNVTRLTVSDFTAGQDLATGNVCYLKNYPADGTPANDVEVGRSNKRSATLLTGNGETVGNISVYVKKVGTPTGGLSFRLESDYNGHPSGNLLDVDGQFLEIPADEITTSYVKKKLISANQGTFTPLVNLLDVTENDEILGGIKFVTTNDLNLKTIKKHDDCNATRVYFWYEVTPGTAAITPAYYNFVEGVATLGINIPSGASCYAVCTYSDLGNAITNIRDLTPTYPMNGKGISIVSGYKYDDRLRINQTVTRTIYYNNNGTTTVPAGGTFGQKFQTKHWTKISKVILYQDAGNLYKCGIYEADGQTLIAETTVKNGLEFVFNTPVELTRGKNFCIIFTVGEVAYSNCYYFNNYASHEVVNDDIARMSDLTGADIWKGINQITCLTYGGGATGFSTTEEYSNIIELGVAEEITIPKGAKAWLVGYEGTYGNEITNATSYYCVGGKGTFLTGERQEYDVSRGTGQSNGFYFASAPMIKSTLYKGFSNEYDRPYIASGPYTTGQLVRADIEGYLPYKTGLTANHRYSWNASGNFTDLGANDANRQYSGKVLGYSTSNGGFVMNYSYQYNDNKLSYTGQPTNNLYTISDNEKIYSLAYFSYAAITNLATAAATSGVWKDVPGLPTAYCLRGGNYYSQIYAYNSQNSATYRYYLRWAAYDENGNIRTSRGATSYPQDSSSWQWKNIPLSGVQAGDRIKLQYMWNNTQGSSTNWQVQRISICCHHPTTQYNGIYPLPGYFYVM